METAKQVGYHNHEMATCKRALRSPYTVDARAVTLALSPFDETDVKRHMESMTRTCLALPFDISHEQENPELVSCADCTYGFQEAEGVKSLLCNPSPYSKAAGNAEACTSCVFNPEVPTQIVDCAVCTQGGRPNRLQNDTCECVM
jgi:hypothetical protein